MKNEIQNKLNEIFQLKFSISDELTMDVFKSTKSSLSSKNMAKILSLNEAMFSEFETALKQYFQFRDDSNKSRISCFRLSLWLETICKNLGLSFSLKEAISNEEMAIKQVRALELIIRDLVNENLGGKENVLIKLQELFKHEVIEKWIKSADDTGVLSGTTFSELSNIFLDRNIFKSIEAIVEHSHVNLSKSGRESLRYILEDIRIIRNSIAHNKRVSNIQIEALNEYYFAITNLIRNSSINKLNPDHYLDLDKVKMENFIFNLREDSKVISSNVEEIKGDVKDIKKDSSLIRKRTSILVIGVASVLLVSSTILFFVAKQSDSTDQIGSDIKDVKEIISGDAELKNMSSSGDLSATKDLNGRTKDRNAKRLAIIYFDNSGGDPAMEKLKKGLADMLITDLSNVNMLDIVERDKLEAILKEQKLSNSKEFDPSTAAKIGKLLGAQIILTGGYFEMMGSLRIDARFIDVETGEILKSDGVEGQTSSFFRVQKQLSWKIIENLDTKISEEEKQGLKVQQDSRALSLNDLKEFSRALDLYDNGKNAEARSLAIGLQKRYPQFAPINNLVKKL